MEKLNRLPDITQAELDENSRRLNEAVVECEAWLEEWRAEQRAFFGDEGDKWSDEQIAVIKAQMKQRASFTKQRSAHMPQKL